MKKRYLKIEREDMGFYIQPYDSIVTAIENEFDGARFGDSIKVTLIEMEESEYGNLEEFDGW